MDMDEIHKLLNIAQGTLAFPKLRAIHDAAMSKLIGHADDVAKAAEEAKAEEQKKAQQASAKVKEEPEEEAKNERRA